MKDFNTIVYSRNFQFKISLFKAANSVKNNEINNIKKTTGNNESNFHYQFLGTTFSKKRNSRKVGKYRLSKCLSFITSRLILKTILKREFGFKKDLS